MAESGCISIDFALESGSPKVLNAIRKDLDVSLVVPFAKKCKKLGIRALVFVMYSMPEETYDDFLMTMDVLRKIKPYIYDVSYNHTLILSGTQMEQQARSMNLLPNNFSWYDSNFSDIPTWKTLMSDEEIAKCRNALENYRYMLHHSKIMYIDYVLRKRLKKLLIISLTPIRDSEIAGRAIHKCPTIHNFLNSIARWGIRRL